MTVCRLELEIDLYFDQGIYFICESSEQTHPRFVTYLPSISYSPLAANEVADRKISHPQSLPYQELEDLLLKPQDLEQYQVSDQTPRWILFRIHPPP